MTDYTNFFARPKERAARECVSKKPFSERFFARRPYQIHSQFDNMWLKAKRPRSSPNINVKGDRIVQEANRMRNRLTFSLGTVGRDMLYTLYSMFLVVYLSEVLDLPDSTFIGASVIMLVMKIYDGFNDPFMGFIVDNTRTRFGKFKPWIAAGAIGTVIFTVFFFTDLGFRGTAFLVAFGVIYFLWEICYTMNDIAYWSMMPSLSLDQKEREKIGSIARICADVGLFAMFAGFTPVKDILTQSLGSEKNAFLVIAIAVGGIMLVSTCIALFGVKEQKNVFKEEEKTTIRDLGRALVKNDQLLVTAVSMVLFMVGYCTTTSFGFYYFKYVFLDEGLLTVFSIIVGVVQIVSMSFFPFFSKRFTRKQLYFGATILVIAGYIVFFFAPVNMIMVGAAGVLIFAGEAFIQILMLMFLADTIEYGQWKLGRRNDSITFAVQPFINKIGNAVGTFVVSITLVISGINSAAKPEDVTPQGLTIMKVAMLVMPLILIVIGYIVYKSKFKIDAEMFAKIVKELKERGDLGDGKNVPQGRPGSRSLKDAEPVPVPVEKDL